MKKLLLVILSLVMVFTLVACGGSGNDDNNAAVQTKMDEADASYQELYSFYEDNGFLETEYTAGLDSFTVLLADAHATHETLLGDPGYSDEEAAVMIASLDDYIAQFKAALEGAQAIMAE